MFTPILVLESYLGSYLGCSNSFFYSYSVQYDETIAQAMIHVHPFVTVPCNAFAKSFQPCKMLPYVTYNAMHPTWFKPNCLLLIKHSKHNVFAKLTPITLLMGLVVWNLKFFCVLQKNGCGHGAMLAAEIKCKLSYVNLSVENVKETSCLQLSWCSKADKISDQVAVWNI